MIPQSNPYEKQAITISKSAFVVLLRPLLVDTRRLVLLQLARALDNKNQYDTHFPRCHFDTRECNSWREERRRRALHESNVNRASSRDIFSFVANFYYLAIRVSGGDEKRYY